MAYVDLLRFLLVDPEGLLARIDGIGLNKR